MKEGTHTHETTLPREDYVEVMVEYEYFPAQKKICNPDEKAAWGPHYGFRALNQAALPSRESRRLIAGLKRRLPRLATQLNKSAGSSGN